MDRIQCITLILLIQKLKLSNPFRHVFPLTCKLIKEDATTRDDDEDNPEENGTLPLINIFIP
mgnify:CR=1 FL=1